MRRLGRQSFTFIHGEDGDASKGPVATDTVLLGSGGADSASVVTHQDPDIDARV